MQTWNLDQLIPLILDCGRTALSYFDYPEKEFKADHSIVTQADHQIEAFLGQHFDQPHQGSYLLGEETIANQSEDYLTQAFEKTAWIIDPIDGTAPFANNLPTWGISIGYMEKGVLKEGAIFLAALGELYYTHQGQSWVEKLGSDPERWGRHIGHPKALSGPRQSDIPPGSMLAISQNLARYGVYNLPYYIQVTGSSVFSMTKLAAGSYGGLITTFKLWDFAACLPLLANLGWTMEFHSQPQSIHLTMDETMIYRQRQHPRRWSCIDHVVFAPSVASAQILRQNCHFAS